MRWLLLLTAALLLAPGVVHAEAGGPARARSQTASKSKKPKKQKPKKPKQRAKKVNGDRKRVAETFETRFLGHDPHGPLAVVRGKTVASPEESACRSWGKRGSEWKALDTFGRVVGEVSVAGMDRYDVTNCDELVLKQQEGAAGAGVYVSGAYEPAAVEPWMVPAGPRKALEVFIARRDARLPAPQHDHKPELPLPERLLTYRTPAGEELAVVGGRGLTVLRFARGRWSVVFSINPREEEVGFRDMFRPLAVLDMNGDGKPEIVVHERDIDAYADFTLTPSEEDGFRVIAAGIHGAFA